MKLYSTNFREIVSQRLYCCCNLLYVYNTVIMFSFTFARNQGEKYVGSKSVSYRMKFSFFLSYSLSVELQCFRLGKLSNRMQI